MTRDSINWEKFYKIQKTIGNVHDLIYK
jgi:hypothetical protein